MNINESDHRAIPEFAPAQVDVEQLAQGGFILRSPNKLAAYPANICSYLHRWAEETPDQTFLAQRKKDGNWRKHSYKQTLREVRAIGQGLIDRGISVEKPVMILSGNSIESGLLQLGAIYAGIPVTPISTAYSLISKDFGKLKHVFDLIQPGLIYTDKPEAFQKALQALDLQRTILLAKEDGPTELAITRFDELTNTTAKEDVDRSYSQVNPDTVAKILFTSGSTGEPKGVINTQRMLCSNQQAIAQIWPFITKRPPVLVDWLPWNHTFGGNHNFNMILRNGGTLYIDEGKPAPGLIETTISNIRAASPTLYFNVPRGFQMILPFLEKDPGLRDHFFSNLDTIFYAAAALPQDLWERLEKLSLAARGEKIAMTSAWGLTETAPLAVGVHFPIERAGVIGLPIPDMDLKMIPNDGRLEMRVKGPNVTPGYYKREELTRAAFDEDGFYLTGDAGKLADPDEPARGVLFDGRTAENFKLLTGSWVNTGAIRTTAVSAGAPIIEDVVVAGHDRDEIGLLIFPNFAACAGIAGLSNDATPTELVNNQQIRTALIKRLADGNIDNQASSKRIARALMMIEPPDIDAGEITDKGYINQSAVLKQRQNLVEQLYSDDAEVIVITELNGAR
jgi:feruloyl-CoA synthase